MLTGFKIIIMRLNISFYIFLAVLFSQCASSKLNKIVAHGLEASIELERDTFLLGEPFYATFTIHNKSKVDFEIDQGKGFYSGGRLDNFDVKIINEDQEILEVGGAYGTNRKDKFDLLNANSSKKYQLFIPRWSEIKEPGKYQIVVKKDIQISTQIRDENDNSLPKAIKIIPKEADASFIIIKDSVRLGKYINNLIEEIEAETEGRIVTFWGLEVGEEDYIPMSKNLIDNMEKLDFINDERIIPFLIRSYKYNINLPRHKILHLLRKFVNDDSVYDLLKMAANDICINSEKNIEVFYSDRDIRQVAISIIISKNTDESLQFLLSKDNKDCPYERYWILKIAKSSFDKERLIKLCKAYLNDENKYVKEKAIEILNQIKSE